MSAPKSRRLFVIIIDRDGKAELRENIYGDDLVMYPPDDEASFHASDLRSESRFSLKGRRRAVFHGVAGGALLTREESALADRGFTPGGEDGPEFYVRILREDSRSTDHAEPVEP